MKKIKGGKRLLSFMLALILMVTNLPLGVFATEETGNENSFSGKTLSILGDSISTYAGVSNDASVNATLSGGAIYYNAGTLGVYRPDTWWQQTIDLLDLELLVNNSWSGSAVLHTRSGAVGAYVDRCVQLHNTAGEEPDIIAVFLGTNDYSYYQSKLGTADINYAALITDNGDGTYAYATPATTCEAYAIMLHKMVNRYPDAEVYCLGLLPRRNPDHDGKDVVPAPTQFNGELKKVIEYFGCHYVDIESTIPADAEAFDKYIGDQRVHPGPAGMDKITQALVDAIVGKKNTSFTVSLDLTNVTADGKDSLVLSGEAFSTALTAAAGFDELKVTVTMGGTDITQTAYADGKVTIASVTGDVVISATAEVDDTPDHYRWELQNNALASTGETENALTRKAGTVSNGVISNAYFQLEKPVVLCHDQPWVVEWSASGNWSGMLLSVNASSSAAGNSYLFKTTQNTGFIGFGEPVSGSFYNYGVALAAQGVDTSAEHIYRAENRIAADGSNMAYLLVDGVDCGPMNNFFISGNSDQGKTVDWLNGRDFCFFYVGANGHPINNCALTYLAVWEGGKPEESLAGKTLSILGASMSTYAGISNDANANATIGSNKVYYTAGKHGVYANDTWWMQAANDLGLQLLVNNSWSGSSLLYERNGTVGAYVDRCVQLHNKAGENPDIIAIQMGTNDFQYYKDTLGTADIDYAALIKANADGTYTYATPVTSLEAAAIVLHKISVRYPGAEVYYLNISQRIDGTDELIRSFNAELKQVVEHFGAHIVDIYGSAITMEKFDTYIGDGKVHPNCLGMDAYTEAFKKALIANTDYTVTTHTVAMELEGVTADYGDDKIVAEGESFTLNLTASDAMEVTVTMGGEDITSGVYTDGKVSITAVTADVVITAKAVHTPKNYRWEFNGTDLACTDGDNALTKVSGTTTDGVFSKTSYSLENTVVLKHDQPWAVEWKCEGTFLNSNGSSGARIFTSDNVNANYNARYIFKSNTEGLIAMGEKTTTGSHNYGIALADHGIDWTAEHTYRLENRIADDGSNMVWLYVDGAEIGPMNHYHVGTTDKNTTSDWLSGKDFLFPYMGTDTHGFTNCSIDYIAVWEGGHAHSYEAVVTEPTCTEQGYTTYTCQCGESYTDDFADALGHSYESGICTACGEAHPNLANYEGKVISILGDSISTFAGWIPAADGFNLEHLARYPQSNLLTDVNETWWLQVVHELDAKLGINDSWRGATVSGGHAVTTGTTGENASMANLTRIQNLGSNGTPDVIILYGGTNDLAHVSKVGSFDPATAPTAVDLTTKKWDNLADGYVHTLLRLKHFYPDAVILCLLPTYTTSYYSDSKLAQANEVLADICQHYGIAYTDLRDCGITTADLPDGIHPDANGMDRITEAALAALLEEEMAAGETTVYTVKHVLTDVKASLGHYKGIRAGEAFVETLTGDGLTVTVTMGGKDITETAYADGKITIEAVTGDLVITARGAFTANGHLQQLPDEFCAGTNLWTALEHDEYYYTVSGWGIHNSGKVFSVTFPVKPGDQIYATSFGKAGTNGTNTNGIRVTWFLENGSVSSVSPDKVYSEFAASGFLTAPENAVAVCVPMWTPDDSNELFILNAEHTYQGTVCTGCGEAHPNAENYSGKVISILSASTSTFAGWIPEADGFNLAHRARYPQDNLLTNVEDTWWHQLITRLDAKLGINDSWAGSQVLNTQDTNSGDLGPDAAMASLTRIQNLGANGTPDIILFFGGGNDMGRGVTLGTFDPATAPDRADMTATKWDSFADAYTAAILRLKEIYPNSRIVVMTTYPMPSYVTNAKLDKYGPVIQAICEHYGIERVSLRDCGVTFDMLPDGIHPNAEGMDYITNAVLAYLLEQDTTAPGENVVYPVKHQLTNAKASLHYYKGISAGKTFTETLTGEDLTVTVTMGGKDITAEAYKDGRITVANVSGELVITARAAFDADGHLQQLPERFCTGTNLWTVLEPENIYYTASGWGNTAAGNSWSITFPVKAGDQIWGTSLGAYPENGSSANGVRVTWFDENGVPTSVDRNTVYQEFAANGYITAPEGAVALNVPMTNNEAHYAVYVLSAEHDYESVITDPTCTEQGYTTHTCSTCGDSFVDSYVDAQGHTEVIDKAVEATCTETGLTEGKHCSVCDEVLVKQNVVPAKGHTEVIDKAVEATCTESGLTEGKHCSVCDEVLVKQNVVPAKGHTEVTDKAVEATCTESGLTEGKHCSVCGEVFVKQNIVPAKGHTEVIDKAVEATCTEGGLTEGKHCSVCGEVLVKQNVIPAKGHTEVIDKAVEATCTETGLTEGKHCSVCDEVLVKQNVVPAKGHTEVTDKAVEATCTESGLTEGKHCSVCDEVLVKQNVIPAKGHTEVTDKAVEATCTESGLTEGKHCSVCGEILVKQNIIPAKGHTEVTDKAVEATCTETGLTEGKHCSVCDEVLVKQNIVPAKGHTEVIDKAVEATCTESGLTEGKHCSVCGEVLVKQNIVPAKGHTEVIDKAVEATCTESGLTEGKHCSVCDEVLVKQTVVAAKGHSWDNGKITKEPTEETEGEQVFTCTVCGETKTQIIPALDHVHDYETVVTAPTCTEKGYTTHTCRCGESFVDSYVDAKGHTEVIDEAVEATCTETGLTEGKHCSVCGEVLVKQNVVPAKGHTEVIDKAVEATCTESGLTEGKHCSVCGEILVKQNIIPAKGHTEVTDKAVEATCTESGLTEGKHCSVCGEVLVKQNVIPAKGHTEVIDKAVEATCTETGLTEGKHCSVCGEVLVKQTVVAAKGHSWDNGKITKEPTEETEGEQVFTCTVCGETKTQIIPALDHVHDYEAVVTAPTCTEKGYTTHTCRCGDSYVSDETEATGHNFTEWVLSGAPTCTVRGWESRSCSNGCLTIEMRELEPTGHTPNIPAPTETQAQTCVTCGTVLAPATGHLCASHLSFYAYKDATCTAAGHIQHYACTCGKNYEDAAATKLLANVVIPAKGHTPTVQAGYEPTCTTAGKTEGSYCARCSTVLVAQQTIPALGHEAVIDEAIAPTCTTSGKTEGSHCGRCGEVLTAQETIPAQGHTSEVIPGIDPTCTGTGLTEGEKCQVCGEILKVQEIIPALGHSEVIDPGKEATCQATGLTEGKHCDVCGEILVPQTVTEKLSHTEETVPGKAPTCMATGLTEGKKCADCGETTLAQTVIPALGHTEVIEEALAPTCTTTGLTEGKHCDVCGTTLISQTIIPALGHSEETIPGKAPTCVDTGLSDGKKCTVCGIITLEQTSVPATGHSWSNGVCGNCGTVCDHIFDENGNCPNCGDGCDHQYDSVVKEPTCFGMGYTTYTCGICGHTYNGDYVNALGHSWMDATCTAAKTCSICGLTEGEPNAHNYDTVVTPPTCFGMGYTTHTCSVCGHSYKDSYVNAIDHSADIPVEENRLDPTCTEEGSYETVTYCALCGMELTRQIHSIRPLGHSYESVVTAPTCTAQGYTTHTCSVCGDSRIDSYTPAAGHSYGQWEVVTEATCTEAGEKKRSCHCGDTLTEVIPTKGHSWQTIDEATMECSVCGEKQSGYRIGLDPAAVADADYAFVDGKKYPITRNGGETFVSVMHTDAANLVVYTVNDPYAADIHTQYPTGMRVWMLKFEDGAYTATHIPEFDNLLQYSGSSIRIVGVKGIRMITSIDKDTRNSLIHEGLSGYKLLEYGTALAWASDLDENNPLVLGREYTKSNFAYKRGEADPIFNRTGNLIQYTNVLVGFDDDQCIPDIVMRPYIILEDEEGSQVTIYGGEVVRNIGYIAWQNRNVFNPGNAAYDYVWNIIHHVYGDMFDEDYKG